MGETTRTPHGGGAVHIRACHVWSSGGAAGRRACGWHGAGGLSRVAGSPGTRPGRSWADGPVEGRGGCDERATPGAGTGPARTAPGRSPLGLLVAIGAHDL